MIPKPERRPLVLSQGDFSLRSETIKEKTEAPCLQLAVTKLDIGLELAQPFSLGPAVVEDLALVLPNIRFPVDLSGGVSRFRHRRGQLARLRLSWHTDALTRWLQGHLHDGRWLGQPGSTLAVDLFPAVHGGIVVGLAVPGAAVAWRIAWMPRGADVEMVVSDARGWGLPLSAYTVALHVTEAVLGAWATERQGSRWVLGSLAKRITREILPRAGARVADGSHVTWADLVATGSVWIASADTTAVAPMLTKQDIVAHEVAALTATADMAWVQGNLDAARAAYLHGLERAPRQREIVRRLAELDATQGRPEAALSFLNMVGAGDDTGCLRARLLRDVGDHEGAAHALEQSAEHEPYAPLAALCFAAAAELTDSLGDRSRLLAAATTRSPASIELRWQRLRLCLDLGDILGAIAETEHLAAVTTGPARYETLTRAADTLAAERYWNEAIRAYEWALRLSPHGYTALRGLGLAFFGAGNAERAAYLLSQAVKLAAQLNLPAHDVVLELARVMGDGLGEPSTALARLRSIPAGVDQTAAARVLEGRYLAGLGDMTDASIAYGRFYETAYRSQPERLSPQTSEWLREAARFEGETRGDWATSKRYLGLALRLRPHDPLLRQAFDEALVHLCDRPINEDRRVVEPVEVPYVPVDRGEEEGRLVRGFFPLELDDLHEHADNEIPTSLDGNAEARVEDLTARVRANPSDIDAVWQLAELLAQLQRDFELVALLSARLEDEQGLFRNELLSLQREALGRLAAQAHREGRASEAELYEQLLAQLV